MMIPKVNLSDPASGRSVQGSVVYVYDREEMPAPTDAPTIRNLAGVLFANVPAASRVAVVLTETMLLMFIFEAGHLWFDVNGNPVGVRRVD